MRTQKKRKKAKKNGLINKEIISIVGIAFSIYLVISVFIPGSGGAFGEFLNGLLRGLFGVGALVFPFGIVALCFNRLRRQPFGKYAVLLPALFLLFVIFLHNNGGAVGAFLGDFLRTIFGSIGTTIIIFVTFIAIVIAMTNKSLVSSLGGVQTKMKQRREKRLLHKAENKIEKGPEKNSREDSYEDSYEDKAYKEPAPFSDPWEKDGGLLLANSQLARESEETPKKRTGRPNFYLFGESENEPPQDEKPLKLIKPLQKTKKEQEPEQAEDVLPEPLEEQALDIKILNEEKPELLEEHEQAEFQDFSPSANIDYVFPSIELLNPPPYVNESLNKTLIYENTRKLEQTLKDFGVVAKVMEVSKGPTVTRYELSPGTGVKVSKISSLADDLALNLAAKGIRIEAPIPGKSAVGIEIPNETADAVSFRELIESSNYKSFPSKLAFALGKDIAGGVMVADIAKMPHLLIAGATGSGKSVCINTLIVSLLYKATPDRVKLIMIDPKVVELSVYNGIPHLLIPVVTDPKKAAGALNWAVREMLLRYEHFATTSTRDLKSYNSTLEQEGKEPLPQIVIIIDELADLMMAAPGEVEDSICRLAQMARAAGIHLIIATQRPSVDVITGLIKANVPSRLAFSVSSGTDSRTILDSVGAEKLLGRGDMLFSPIGTRKPMRIQGAFISDKEVESIVAFLKAGNPQTYDNEMIENITSSQKTLTVGEDKDEFFEEAVELVITKEKASTSMLQRQFRIGYQRASRIIETLEEQGIIGPEDGSKPRKVLMSRMQWEDLKKGDEA